MNRMAGLWRNARCRFGLVFIGMAAVVLASSAYNGDIKGTLPIMLIFFGIGAGIIVIEWLRLRKARRLKENGRAVWGKVVSVETDASLRINGRHPKYLVVACTQGDGTVSTYNSQRMFLSAAECYVGAQVRVYLSLENRKDFYVDTDSLFESAERF